MANQLKEELVLGTQQFDSNINKVIKKVEELKHKGGKVGDGFETSMGKMIEQATGFNGSLGSLIGVVGKFGGALGVAMGAGEAFNKTIQSSQSLTDEYGRVQQSVTTVVDNFFTALANGNFSSFLNGMDNIINKAREAYNEMDSLWNMAQSFGVQNARLNNQFQKNLNVIREKKNSNNPEDKKLVEKAKKDNEKIIKQQSQGATKLYNQTIRTLQTKLQSKTGMSSKISEGAIYQIVENDINNLKGGREQIKKDYQAYQNETKKLQRKYAKTHSNGGGLISKLAAQVNPNANYGKGYQKELQRLQQKYGKAIVGNYMLNSMSDKELEEFNNQLKQGIAYENISLQNQSKMLRYGNEIDKLSGGGGKKGGRSGGGSRGGNNANVVTYTEDSLAALEAKLSALQANIRNGLIPQSEIDATYNQIEDLKKKIYQKKIELRLEVATVKLGKNNTNLGSLEDSFSKSAFQVTGLDSQTMEDFNENLTEIIQRQTQEQIDAIRQTADAWGYYSDILGSVGQAMSVLGDTTEAQMARFVVSQAAAVAQMIMQLHQIIAANQAAAMAKGIQSASGLMFPYNLAAIATVVAAIAGTFASLPKFAEGGIVGGSSFGGDRLVARVNSGEMILNGLQQKHLFDLLDGGGITANGGAYSVEWKLRGADLYGSLKNYSKGAAKTNKITGIL